MQPLELAARLDQRRKLDLHQRGLDRRRFEDRLALARLCLAGRDHPTAISDRPQPPVIDQRHVLHREDNRRHVVERFERRHADPEVAVRALRVNVVPALIEQRIGQADAGGEAGQVAIENEKLCEQREQPDVARAIEQRRGGREFGGEIDRSAVERLALRTGEIRCRQQPFGARDEIHVLRIAGEIEIRPTWFLIRNGPGERCEFNGRHP